MDYKQLNSPPPPYPGTAPPHDMFQYQPEAQHHVYQPMQMMAPAPAPASAPAPAPAPAPVHMVQTSVVVNTSGSETHCPRCNAQIRVLVKYHPSWKTYCFSALLFLVGCWPCVCLPCCANSCYRTSQFCPRCKLCLASY